MTSGRIVVYSPETAKRIDALLALFPDRTIEAMRGAQMQFVRLQGTDGVTRIQKVLAAPIASTPGNVAAESIGSGPPPGYEEVERIFYDEDDCETSITDTILRKIVP